MTNDELRELNKHRQIQQIAFLSRDLERSMQAWIDVLRIGPWRVFRFTEKTARNLKVGGKPVEGPFAATVVLACALASPALASDAAVTDKALIAFRDVCLATAPSFDKAMAAARKFGVKPQMDLGAGMVGMAPGNAFSVQVRARKECAVTAESDPDPGLDAQFRGVVAEAGGLKADSLAPGRPITLTLHGRTYVVRHDRRGAEAYVIIDAAGL
ncbi:hypothetical protein [Labrys monachus]|uniref:Uncharacterized protein n=1 Tax=Labrys monachus TaxID=217067 RepID=A0ABU0FB48_9HYPH|nr:hypothetical protein [Labrys monachus]MDQ0391776.1 hypothetical protein [Labrys monachus]